MLNLTLASKKPQIAGTEIVMFPTRKMKLLLVPTTIILNVSETILLILAKNVDYREKDHWIIKFWRSV